MSKYKSIGNVSQTMGMKLIKKKKISENISPTEALERNKDGKKERKTKTQSRITCQSEALAFGTSKGPEYKLLLAFIILC